MTTPEGRRRQAEAGAENLQRAKAKAAVLMSEIEAKVAQFEADLVAEIGTPLTASQVALVDAAAASYQLVCLGISKASLASLGAERFSALGQTIAQHQNSLRRALKTLGLPRPPAEPEPMGIASWRPTKPSEDNANGDA